MVESTKSVYVQFYEIHGKKCYDLMDERKNLRVLSDSKERVWARGAKTMGFVLRLEGEGIEGAVERWRKALAGPLKLRSTQATQRNDVSSRSHSIFTITLVDEEKIRREKEVKAREEAAKKLDEYGDDLSNAKFDFDNPPSEEDEEDSDDEVNITHPAYPVVNKKIRLVDLAGSEQNADTGTMAALDHKVKCSEQLQLRVAKNEPQRGAKN